MRNLFKKLTAKSYDYIPSYKSDDIDFEELRDVLTTVDFKHKLFLNKKVYVLDTNIILDSPENILKVYDKNNIVVIPDIVLKELDDKKVGFDDINYNAREFARLLSGLKVVGVIKNESLTLTHLKNKDLELYLSYKNNYISTQNDDKIIENTKQFPKATLLTMDTYCKLKAIVSGVKTEDFGSKDNNLKFEFIKYMDAEHPENGIEVANFDKDYKIENYNYVIKNSVGSAKLYQVFNDRLYELTSDIEKQDIKPIGIGQKFMVGGILSDFTNIITINAVAGSGKTLLALSTAMHLIKQKKYNKIIYIRNSIESLDRGEDIGYLPGLEEKFAIYNHPLYDCIKIIARTQLEKSNNNKSKKHIIDEKEIQTKADELKEKFNISTMWIGEMRGRTISDAVVIVDEAQNFSSKSLQTAITRIDKTCKLICIGSNNQIDNIYTNKYSNGLAVLLNACKTKHPEINLFASELTKVLRGPITEFAERIFN